MVHANTGTRTATRFRGGRRRAASLSALVVLTLVVVLAGPSPDARAADQVGLGTAGSFAVLAGSAISNTGPTTITGDVGIHPGASSSVTGFGSVTLNGQPHYGDGVARQAKDDLTTAYNDAASQPVSATVATELGNQVLTGGVYRSASGTFGMTGALTLDGQGTSGTVWIFQTDTTLVTASNSEVVLVNGANACNVFWQVGSSATLGTGTSFAGNILAAESVTLNTSAAIRGRALARNGAVTMDTNTITRTSCPTQAPPASPSPTPSPSPSSSPSPSVSPSPSPSPAPSSSPTPTPTSSTTPAPVATASPSETAAPVGGTTGTPDGSADAPETPDASEAPGAPDAAAPPTSATPQVPVVPTGSIAAGDGSTADDGGRLALLLLPVVPAMMVVAAWRRRNA